MKYQVLTILLIIFLAACNKDKELPIYGKSVINSPNGTDTLIKKIPPFTFTNQMGKTITEKDFKDKIYVTEFFFSHCPSICPVMKRNMLEVYKEFGEEEDFLILSHTIDPKRDSVQRLNDYGKKLGIENPKKWHLVTGDYDDIYAMAKEYMISAYEDENVPGGFEHSGKFTLIDKKKQIRGYYDGTIEEEVTQMIKDIKLLLKENQNE